MRLEKVQEALKTKKIHYEYTEENGCGSIDFMFRGLRFHIWDYEDVISDEILSWPDMLPGM